MYAYRYLMVGTALFLLVSFPYNSLLLESSMVGTMIIQIPLLVCSGYFLAKGFPLKWKPYFNYFNENGVAGILLAIFILLYWILPRSIDAALNNPFIELAKYTSLPLLAGTFLFYSWGLLGPISKSFIWANGISMIFVMSWLYTVSPVRICNNYLVTAQQQLGKALFVIGLVISFLFIVRVFIGKPNPTTVKSNFKKVKIKSKRFDGKLT